MQYSWPYLLYFLFLLLLHVVYGPLFRKEKLTTKGKTKKSAVIAVAIISYLLFYGLRGYIYTDCFQYIDCFENIETYLPSIGQPDARYESAYIIFNYIISWFTDNYFVFLFIWTVIDILLIHIIIKRECPKYYLLAFALLLPFWTGVQMNLFRNEKAILIFFLCLSYIRKNKTIKYMCWMAVDFFFHSTSLFFIPMYFIIRTKSKKFWLICCAVSIGFYFLGLTGLFDQINQLATLISYRYGEKAAGYTEGAVDSGFTFGFIFRLVLIVVYLYYYKPMIKKNYITTNLALLYLCFNMAFNSILVFRDRFTVLVVLGLICSLPYLMECIKQEKSLKALYKRKIIKTPILNKKDIPLPIQMRVLISMGTTAFIALATTAYLYVQTNGPAGQYENVLTGVSDRQKAEIRIFNAAMDAENR